MKFIKKPIVVEAIQYFRGRNEGEITEFTEGCAFEFGDGMDIPTLEGDMHVSDMDWVIRGVAGEYYSCKPDIFGQTYEVFSDNR